MSTAREDVLARVRAALGPDPVAPPIPREYAGAEVLPNGDLVERFCARAAAYRAVVQRVERAELSAAIAAVCVRHGARRVVVAPGLAGDLGLGDGDGLPGVGLPGVETVADDPPLSPRALDALDGVLSGCALAIADTGTIVLDGGARSGRRALTLVPDLHVCVVEAAAIVVSIPAAIAALAPAASAGRPLTFVSGPSATSDIELERVEGVHGPRRLELLVVR